MNLIFKKNKERLDKFLITEFPEYSRSFIQKLIIQGLIIVNGKKTKVHHFLKEKDEVKINLEEIKKEKEKKEIKLLPYKKEIEIIFENINFLVINKPVGLIVHQSPSHPQPDTLVNILLHYYPYLREIGENPLRPGIVHRLDKDVSGLMVIAKNNKNFFHLKKQFQERKIKKEYLALVYGQVKKEKGIINLAIRRKDFRMTAQKEGKPSLSIYEIIKQYKKSALLKIQTKTGRMHQIRVHLKAIGHPLIGDPLYSSKQFKKISFSRIFLHAYRLGFYDLENNWREFKIALPQELNNFLKTHES